MGTDPAKLLRPGAFPAIPRITSAAPVLSASFRRYYPVQVIRVSRSGLLVAYGPLSQHPLPQQKYGTHVKYCNNYNLSMVRKKGRRMKAAASCISLLNSYFTSDIPKGRPSLKFLAFSIVTAAIACSASLVKNAWWDVRIRFGNMVSLATISVSIISSDLSL